MQDDRTVCPWMLEARLLLGQGEIPGPKTAGFIAAALKRLHAWWGDDETPWCGVFVASCLQAAGYPIAKEWWKARGWVGFGQPFPANERATDVPYGALVVLDRPPSKANGHVGFYAGTARDRVVLLGGNQGTKEHPTGAVSYASFPRGRVVYWCWPGAALDRNSRIALANRATGVIPNAGTSRGEA